MALITLTTALTTPTTAPTTLAMAPTTPITALIALTTCRPLPLYKGRMINNTNLIKAIDQVPLHHNRSTRPVRARRLIRLDTDLVVTDYS
jgi:hypothetical protein